PRNFRNFSLWTRKSRFVVSVAENGCGYRRRSRGRCSLDEMTCTGGEPTTVHEARGVQKRVGARRSGCPPCNRNGPRRLALDDLRLRDSLQAGRTELLAV